MYEIYCRLGCISEVSFHETTKAIQMDDEWWNDRIQVIFEHHSPFLFKNYNKLILIFLFTKYLMFQSSEHTPSLISAYWINFLDANAFNRWWLLSRFWSGSEPEIFTENEYNTVNLEDDSDGPARNQNETPSSYNHSS